MIGFVRGKLVAKTPPHLMVDVGGVGYDIEAPMSTFYTLPAIGKILEYTGQGIEAMGVDERVTLTNMAAEIGAFTGIVAPDRTTIEWLAERRGLRRVGTALASQVRPRQAT